LNAGASGNIPADIWAAFKAYPEYINSVAAQLLSAHFTASLSPGGSKCTTLDAGIF
jgi:hypothetical protein